MPDIPDLFGWMREKAAPAYGKLHWEGTFPEFLSQKLETDPYRYTRTAYQMLADMLEHFGTEETVEDGVRLVRYRLFDDPFEGGRRALFGLSRVIERIAHAIKAAAKEEGKERILILNGPVGTAKTSLVDLISRGLEEYSRLPEGELLTFSWKFPRHLGDEGGKLGFRASEGGEDTETFARVPCQLHDPPVYLIPRPERAAYLTGLFARAYADARTRPLVPRKILEGDLCFNCQAIARHLLRHGKGDWNRVVSRVVVERFVYSELAGTGIAKVLPEGNVEGGAALLAFDENYKAVAQLLSDITLVRFAGKYVHGNRGVMHYSDIFKKPAVYLQHLLSACEEHKVDFGEVGADVDVAIFGTTNPPEYEALKKNPIAHGLRSRMRKIEVPYLLLFTEERKIYDQALREAARATHIAPHTTEMAALWAVLTRLERSRLNHDNAQPEPTRKVVAKLSPLHKALLYSGEMPADLTAEERRALPQDIWRRLRREIPTEGMGGVSTRVVQNLLADICETGETRCVTPFELFKALRRLIAEGPEIYDFLAQEEEGDYHDADKLLEHVVARYDRILLSEIEMSAVEVDIAELDGKVRDYLRHVRAYNAHDKVTNPKTGADEDPDEKLLRFVESRLAVEDGDRDDFRFKVLARATSGARADGGKLDLRLTYSDLYKAVLEGRYHEQRAEVNWRRLERALAQGEAGLRSVDDATRRKTETLLGNLVSGHGYCSHCARDGVLYAVGKGLLA